MLIRRIEHRLRRHLSHHPKWYAFIVGVGIVLFWRGVWHSADQVHLLIEYFSFNPSISLTATPWWDGPLSLFVGASILYITGAFTSSFIGGELILSGLRGERRLNEKTESDLKEEVIAIADIKEELTIISKKLELLEKKAHQNHTHIS
jgi:hypothetical protein